MHSEEAVIVGCCVMATGARGPWVMPIHIWCWLRATFLGMSPPAAMMTRRNLRRIPDKASLPTRGTVPRIQAASPVSISRLKRGVTQENDLHAPVRSAPYQSSTGNTTLFLKEELPRVRPSGYSKLNTQDMNLNEVARPRPIAQ